MNESILVTAPGIFAGSDSFVSLLFRYASRR
jgi:hypothetical protein